MQELFAVIHPAVEYLWMSRLPLSCFFCCSNQVRKNALLLQLLLLWNTTQCLLIRPAWPSHSGGLAPVRCGLSKSCSLRQGAAVLHASDASTTGRASPQKNRWVMWAFVHIYQLFCSFSVEHLLPLPAESFAFSGHFSCYVFFVVGMKTVPSRVEQHYTKDAAAQSRFLLKWRICSLWSQ